MKFTSQIPLIGQDKQFGSRLGALSKNFFFAKVRSLPWPTAISEGLSSPCQPKWAPRSSRGEGGDERRMDGKKEEGRDEGKRRKERVYMRLTVQGGELYWLHNMSEWCTVDSQLGAFVSRESIVWGSEQLSGYEESVPASDNATDRQIHADTQNSLIPLLWVKQSNERMRSSAKVGWIEGKQSSLSSSVC